VGEPAKPNIVLYVIDTLRADHLGAYGHEQDTSPALDRLASQSIVFERAHSPAPWTLPSIVSILTSLPPCEHQVIIDGRRLAPEFATWAERMKQAGYVTASFYGNAYAGSISGLDRGFDQTTPSGPGGRGVARWLESRPDGPFFLYLHTVEPHDPYETSPIVKDEPSLPAVSPEMRQKVNGLLARFRELSRADWSAKRPLGTTDTSDEQASIMAELASLDATVRNLYDIDIRIADIGVASVILALMGAGEWQNTVFAITSDHGEAFGEHDSWQHDQSLYEELLHVPLLIHLPGDRLAGRRIEQPVSLIDLVPTLLDAAGRSDVAALGPGTSWWPWIDGRGEAPTAPVASLRENLKKYYGPIRRSRGDRNLAWIEDRWKLIWNLDLDRAELYDLGADPQEKVDLSASEPDRARRMLDAARAWHARCIEAATHPPVETQIDDTSRDQLRALGYVN